MRYYNFFKDKAIFLLFSIFIVLSIIHIIFAASINRGLFGDGFVYVPEILDKLSIQGYGFQLIEDRTRIFINFINQLPINIGYWCGIESKKILLFLFSLPLFLFPFLVNLYNIHLAKRTKRYDIVLYSLIVYGILILPCIMYAVVESYLAISFLLLLIHYLVANIDYKIKDIIIISILLILSFNSTEIVIFTGPILFFISLFYTKENIQLKQKIIKLYIGFISICASAYVAYMNYFVLYNIKNETTSFFSEICSFITIFQEPYIVEIITYLLILITLFIRKKLIKIQIILLSFLYIGILVFIFINNNPYFVYINYTKYRVFIYFLFPILVGILSFQEFYKKFINKRLLNNLFILILIASISNTIIQLYYSFATLQQVNNFKKCIENTNEVFIIPDTILDSVYFAPKNNIFFNTVCPTADYITLIENNDKIVLPFQNLNLSTPVYKKFDIDNNKKQLIFSFLTLSIKNKFWDFSNLATKYDKKYLTYNIYSEEIDEDKIKLILSAFNYNKEGQIIDIDSKYFIQNLCTDDVKKELYYTLLNDKTIQNIKKNTE